MHRKLTDLTKQHFVELTKQYRSCHIHEEPLLKVKKGMTMGNTKKWKLTQSNWQQTKLI